MRSRFAFPFPAFIIAVAALPGLLAPVAASAADQARYQIGVKTPNGIGKYYLGREIAHYMTHHGAPWLERADREREERPDLLLKALALQPGMVVADIGCGSGYHSRRIAKLIGTNGVVYGVDIQKEMLALLEKNAKAERLGNIKGVLGTTQDPNLPEAAIDLALLVDVYHEFDHPYEMMQAITKSLKPGGRVVFVEFRLEDPTVPIKLLHKMSEEQVRKEMAAQPLEWVETIRTLPWQHAIVFRRK